jgi:hypothetical protein
MTGTRVDALALMLDGHVTRDGRFDRTNVACLEKGGHCDLMYYSKFAPDVAQAIGELEALADWSPSAGPRDLEIELEPLARAAFEAAGGLDMRSNQIDTCLLEAAAILRDGWRPMGWSL